MKSNPLESITKLYAEQIQLYEAMIFKYDERIRLDEELYNRMKADIEMLEEENKMLRAELAHKGGRK